MTVSNGPKALNILSLRHQHEWVECWRPIKYVEDTFIMICEECRDATKIFRQIFSKYFGEASKDGPPS